MPKSLPGLRAARQQARAPLAAVPGLAAVLLACVLAAGVEVTIETTAGEILTGTVVLGDLKLKTDYGSVVVLADQVAQINFGEPDVVVTKGDDELRGELAITTLKLETAAGSKTLKRKELKSLVIGGGGGDRIDFTGSWMLTSGNLQSPLSLKQSGLRVTGKYGHEEEFSLEGKVKGRTLTFELSEGGGQGEGTAELWEGGQYFLGEVQLGAEKLPFGAYRRETKPAEPKPGEVTEGQSEAGLIYYLRVPKAYDGQRRYPLVVITHGSNMSSRGYVETFPAAWPKLAEDVIVVGVNGERLAGDSKPGNVAHNATYINFSGPDVGPPIAHRQTPALLAETVQELVKRLPVDKVFLGGHSQGGFLTYATALYYPQLFDGIFPMSCNLLVQCEPNAFKADAIEKQLHLAVAPIHGRSDKLVEFSSGEYCYQRMQEFGFPRLHFFAVDAGHEFMNLPVEEAVRWLQQMTSDDPAQLLDFAEKQVAAKEWRDAMGAVLRARELDQANTLGARADALANQIDAQCAAEAERLADAIGKNKDNGWVDDYWEFRRQFGCAPAARDCVLAYEKLKERHTKPANDLFWAARGASDEDARKAKYKEIAEEYYASTWWIIVRDKGK
jgi:pimeloyl-ACP methyl ester carboxylesterase